jgi:uncharacterized membrane protein (UPF0182 family)
LIFGPLQIEGRIDQDPDISSQITLWDQGGSEVIRGNLLVLPIENSLLYVEPLYLRAENGQIPELKRVILSSGERIVMRPTLAEALVALFEGEEPVLAATDNQSDRQERAAQQAPTGADDAAPEAETIPLTTDVAELAQLASDHFEAAQEALQAGDWATYGEELDKMEDVLRTLVRVTGEQ